MKEQQEDLKAYVERRLDEVMRGAGFTPLTPQKETKEPTPITGRITFLKGEKVKQAREYFQKLMDNISDKQ